MNKKHTLTCIFLSLLTFTYGEPNLAKEVPPPPPNNYKPAFNTLYKSIIINDTTEIKKLLDQGMPINQKIELGINNALMLAIVSGNLKIIEILLKNGADPNQINSISNVDALNVPILIFAIYLLNEDAKKYFDCVELLLNSKSDPNVQDANGWTPLMLAIKYHNLPIVDEPIFETIKLLLEKGANPNFIATIYEDDGSSYKMGPLHLAIRKKSPRIVDLLLEFGAKTDIKGFEDKTPIELAIESKHSLINNSITKHSVTTK